MFKVMTEVSQVAGISWNLQLSTSPMGGHAPSAWPANSTYPFIPSSFCTGLGADAEAAQDDVLGRGTTPPQTPTAPPGGGGAGSHAMGC